MLTNADLTSAIEGEGWAINDYKDKITRAKTLKEKRVLTHIMNEEKSHLGMLLRLRCIS